MELIYKAFDGCGLEEFRTQQGRQSERSLMTLRLPLSAEFWRHCVLSGRTQRRALSRHQSEEMEI